MRQKLGILGIITIMIFLAVCSAIAHAQMSCRDAACSGATYGTIDIFSKSADMFPAPGDTTYISCLSDNSIFQPVISDINDDQYSEIIIVPTRNLVEVLDKDCNIISSLITTLPINAPPALVNPTLAYTSYDSNMPLYAVAIMTNQTLSYLTRYGLGEPCPSVWTAETCAANYGASLDYMSITGNKALFGLTCTDQYCFATNQPGTTINFYSFSMGSGVIVGLGNTTSASRWSVMNNATVGFAQKYLTKSYASYCGISLASDISTQCFVLNSTPSITNSYTGFGASGSITALHDYFAGYVKMGTLYKYIFTGHATKGGFESSNLLVKDSASLSTSFSVSGTSNTVLYISQPSVGDYDNDGTIELCYLQGDKVNNTDGNISQFVCWTNTFLTTKYNLTVNRSDNLLNMTFPAGFYMADYNFSSAYKYIGTKDGIFDIEGSRKVLAYASLAGSNGASRYTDTIVQGAQDKAGLSSNLSYFGHPILTYYDTSNSWILRSGLAIDICGDGVCTGSESIVTCPADCLGTFNGSCNFDVQCTALIGNYNKCLNHTCVKGYTGLTCIDYNDCPPNQSICFSGYCIAGYYGTLPTSTASAQKAYKDQLTYWVDYLLGGSSFIKMIIAIILIIAAMAITWAKMAEASGQQPHPIFPLLAGLAMTILCTVFALIPIWFLIIMILGGLIVWLFLRFMLNPGTSGG